MSLTGEYALETPESIEVTFELAGPGSRFCAMAIDTLLLWLLIFVLFIALALFAAPIGAFDADDGGGWVLALGIVAAMVALFGYYTFFELILNGQTPGKRSLRLRVIRDDGTPALPLDIVLRNLVRVVDALPGVYVVGGIAALFSAQHKRLGDMAAGTIVVKEGDVDYRAAADKQKKRPQLAEATVANPALSAEERRLLRGFLQRRIELLPDARSRLAAGLAERLHAVHGGELGDPEVYLERLAEGRQHGN